MEDKMDSLYLSDFLISDPHLLNTLCLYYDRVFIHDFFGVYASIADEGAVEALEEMKGPLVDMTWSLAGGLPEDAIMYFRRACDNVFDALVLKGVGQGLAFTKSVFSPTFVMRYADKYAQFLRGNRSLISDGVLAMCQTRKNPHHPCSADFLELRLDLGCSDESNSQGLKLARDINKLACVFEQEYHNLPLISDSEEDGLRWDRSTDLLTTAILMTSVHAQVPGIGNVSGETLLEAKDRLADTLPPFRSALLRSAWDIASAARDTTRSEVMSLTELYYQTRIAPAVSDLSKQLDDVDKKLNRKLIARGVDQALLVAKAFDPTDAYSKWELLGSGLKSALDIADAEKEKTAVSSPYEFLVRLPQHLS